MPEENADAAKIKKFVHVSNRTVGQAPVSQEPAIADPMQNRGQAKNT